MRRRRGDVLENGDVGVLGEHGLRKDGRVQTGRVHVWAGRALPPSVLQGATAPSRRRGSRWWWSRSTREAPSWARSRSRRAACSTRASRGERPRRRATRRARGAPRPAAAAPRSPRRRDRSRRGRAARRPPVLRPRARLQARDCRAGRSRGRVGRCPRPRPVTHSRPRASRHAAGALLCSKLRAARRRARRAIPRVVGATDDEAIHDLRVAIRRLRTLLKLARPVFGALPRRRRARRVHGRPPRDRDAPRRGGPRRDARRARERRARRSSRGRCAAARASGPCAAAWSRASGAGDLARARRLLAALVTLPVRPEARSVAAAKLARRARRARAARTSSGSATPRRTTGSRSTTCASRTRSSATPTELLADALPADLAAMAEPASKFQKRLGEIHDVDMALAAVKRARGLDDVDARDRPRGSSKRCAPGASRSTSRRWRRTRRATPEAHRAARFGDAARQAVGVASLLKISSFFGSRCP